MHCTLSCTCTTCIQDTDIASGYDEVQGGSYVVPTLSSLSVLPLPNGCTPKQSIQCVLPDTCQQAIKYLNCICTAYNTWNYYEVERQKGIPPLQQNDTYTCTCKTTQDNNGSRTLGAQPWGSGLNSLLRLANSLHMYIACIYMYICRYIDVHVHVHVYLCMYCSWQPSVHDSIPC